MSTPQATLMSFNDYQTYLAAVNVALDGKDGPTAKLKLAQAQVVLAGLPEEVLTGQQTTRFREIASLDSLRMAIDVAISGGTGFGLFGFTQTR